MKDFRSIACGFIVVLSAIVTLEPSICVAEGYSPRTLSPAETAEDLSILHRTLQTVHPGFDRYTSAEAMNALLDDVKYRHREGTTVVALYVEISRILTQIRCDHTKAELPDGIEAARKQTPSYLPFSFRLIAGHMFVDRLLPAIEAEETAGRRTPPTAKDGHSENLRRGDEILRLNGRPVGDVLAEIEDCVSVDGWTDATKSVEMEYSTEYLGDAVDHFWPLLYGWASRWTIDARDMQSGRTKTWEQPALTYAAWLEMTTGKAERYVNFPESVRFEPLNTTTGYLSIGTFVNYRDPVVPESVFDPLFDQIRDLGLERLILDLRQCGGGSDDVPAALISYLSDTIVPAARQSPWVRTFRFGDLRPYLSTWDESAFEMPAEYFSDLGNGYFQLREEVGEPHPAPPRDNRFRGSLVVLTSRANASGATNLIALLQEHYGARIIGERTGGSAEGPTAGILFFLKLPHSGIVVRVPGMRAWNNVSHPRPGQGVIPDVEIGQTVEDWRKGRDPILEAAMN